MLISTGSDAFDRFLCGGYETDIITTIYGPAGAGKSNLAIVCAVETALTGKKVIYMDTEGGFSVARLKQLTDKHEEVMKNIIFIKPTSFEEQKKSFEALRVSRFDNIGLFVVDSIAMLYRLAIGRKRDIYETNKDLALQLGFLTEIARKKDVPILITNQVYSSFEDKEKVNMVGGDILKYSSKCLIELKKLNNKRMAILQKHRSQPENKKLVFEIKNDGLYEFGESSDEHNSLGEDVTVDLMDEGDSNGPQKDSDLFQDASEEEIKIKVKD